MIKHRRAISVALASLALVCAALAIVDAFELAELPGAGLYGPATWLILGATWAFPNISSRSRPAATPKSTRRGPRTRVRPPGGG